MASEYLTMQELRARGWNDRLVRTFLGTHDDTFIPAGKRPGRPTRLFLLTRVLQVETFNADFLAEKDRTARMAERNRRSADVKMEHFIQEIESVDFPAFDQPFDELLANARTVAVRSLVGIPADRLALTVLLDRMKPLLDKTLAMYFWHPGIRDARAKLRMKALAHVVNHYPGLEAAAKLEARR
ncbi:hypothetical protein GCM10027343_37220 [Noviherbaspirillum agri]